MTKLFLIFFLLVFQFWGYSQEKPYFQQEVNYKISVVLDDVKHNLQGEESLEYMNNSPDELSYIWFHLWPNAYKNNRTPLAEQLIADGNLEFYFASEEERGSISKLDFKVNGQPVKTEPGASIDIVRLILNQPLKPGEKITITTPFEVHIPLGIFSRLGHIAQQYQITQWYPKPAVYDRYGWHPIPYLNQGEFYSEFGNFDVSITVPENYVIGATGTLVNGEEEIAWLMKKAEETKAMEKFNPHDISFPASSSGVKTLRYQASDVHDFAWFADKRYHVLHGQVELPSSKKKVDTWVMFTNQYGNYWKKSLKYVNDAVYYYSLWNGDYPYPHATAVDGALSAGGGMEYPMITVIGKAESDYQLDRVIAHEVGHNWFYGILGSNERDHAWMDEGINSFNENRYMEKKYPRDSVGSFMEGNLGGMKLNIGKLVGIPNLNESALFDLGYRFNATRKQDQPADMTSAEYTSINYGIIVYGKTAVLLAYLQAYLGEEMYDKCARAYFEAWKFRHPYPSDIKKVYEEVSGKDLSWFFDSMIQTTNQLDYKIVSVTDRKQAESGSLGYGIKVKNRGEVFSPFSVSGMKDGKAVTTTWFDGFDGVKKLNIPAGDFDHLRIDAANKIPDINRKNNTLKMRGLFKKAEPFNLKMLGVVPNTDKTQLFWVPVIGWNNYNKFMLGAVIYNNILPEKKFEYVLMPMYGFGNKDLAGGASIHYTIHPRTVFQTIRLGVNGERYCYANIWLRNLNYNKVSPELVMELKKKHLNNPLTGTVKLRRIHNWNEFANWDTLLHPGFYRYDTNYVVINDFTWQMVNNRKINPYSVSLNVQQGEEFVKSSVLANYRLTFRKKSKGLDIRFFAGKFLNNEKLKDGNYYLYASDGNQSWGAGYHDYLHDRVFLGRSETGGFLSRQFAETEGAMKVYTPLGRTRDWIGAVNFNCSLPGKIPFSLFMDVTAFSKDYMSTVGVKKQYLLYDMGLHFTLIRNIVDVYLPLLMSSDIKSTFYANNLDLKTPSANHPDPDMVKRTLRMVRFTFNIHTLNPFEFVRNLSL